MGNVSLCVSSHFYVLYKLIHVAGINSLSHVAVDFNGTEFICLECFVRDH